MERVKRLFEHAKQCRTPFESVIRECYRYTLPEREPFTLDKHSVPDREPNYDTTAREAVKSLITAVMTLLIPASKRWAQIQFRTTEYRNRYGTGYAAVLNDANERLQRHLLESNFYLAVSEAMGDAVIAGVGCLAVIDEDGKPLSYMAIPSDQMCFTEAANGSVDAVFREHQMTTRQILDRWPHISGAEEYDEDNEQAKHTVLEAVIPEGSRFRYIVVNCKNWDEPIMEEEVRYNPFVVWRFEKQHSPWGNSPVADALPSIRSVNRMIEDILKNADFMSSGLWWMNDQNLNIDMLVEQFRPGGTIYSQYKPEALQFPGELRISLEMVQQTRNDIRTMLLMQPQRDPNKTPPTAEQIITDREQFFQRVGEPAQRLQYEMLDPITKQIVGRLSMRDELYSVQTKQSLAQISNSIDDVFTVEINAAIVRGMKAAEAMNDIRSVQVAYTTVGDRLWTILDADKLTRKLLNDLGIDPGLIRSDEDVKAITQQQQQQAQLAQIQQTLASPAGRDLLNVVGNQVAQQQAQNL